MLDLSPEQTEALELLTRFVALWRNEVARSVETKLLHDILKETRRMSDTIMNELTRLQADVAAQSTVIASATTAFQGLASQLAAAETAAVNAGATDSQIAGIVAVRQGLESNTAALAAAIPANTPSAPTPAAVTQPSDPASPTSATTSSPNSAPAAPTSAPASAAPATPDLSAAAGPNVPSPVMSTPPATTPVTGIVTPAPASTP